MYHLVVGRCQIDKECFLHSAVDVLVHSVHLMLSD